MNLLEPWVLLRLSAGLLACLFFARAALTAQKVVRHFDLRRTNEGQLALERQFLASATFLRLGAVLQCAVLALSALGADRMSRGVRGAMCAYGVFASNEWGFRSFAATAVVAVAAGVVAQIHAFDGRVRTFELARPVAWLTLAMLPLSIVDLSLAAEYLGNLDLTVVASCCSVQLDPVSASGEQSASGPRLLAVAVAVPALIVASGASWFAARRPTRAGILATGAVTLVALPAALAASVLEVAPHAFEVPHHNCPFCLLRSDVLGIGYPLYAALFLAAVWTLGAASSSLLAARTSGGDRALFDFSRSVLRRSAFAWSFALVVGIVPVVRYAYVSGGASLFERM